MHDRKLRLLQVSTADIGGGAEKVAWDLFRSYRARGCDSWLAVGKKRSSEPNVIAIPRSAEHNSWSRFWLSLEQRLQRSEINSPALNRVQTALRTLARPCHELGARLGLEDFDFPGSKQLLELTPEKPDIIHCHNLHGGYFDLRWLPRLSRQAPVVLTLHDAWLLSGHCAHSFECQRWKSGCGQCPDLTIYPAISRDATAYNWRRKQSIFSRSGIYVSTPAKWLMKKVEHSLLSASIKEARVIPNGVDLTVFHPGDRRSVRAALDMPEDSVILLFTAYGGRANAFKDYVTLRAAIGRAAPKTGGRLVCVCLGGEPAVEWIGNTELRLIPYQTDPKTVAQYYQAADLYIHASRIDTFPCAVLEALACGTPVVATAVGGIPEQIKGLNLSGCEPANGKSDRYGAGAATGILVPAGDTQAMAGAIEQLINEGALRLRMGENAAKDAAKRLGLQRQADDFLAWYQEILERERGFPRREISVLPSFTPCDQWL